MKSSLVLLAILLASAAVAGCSGEKQPAELSAPAPVTTSPTVTMAHTSTTPVPTPISQASVSDNTVKIRNFAFFPASISVPKGSIVRWENADSAPHRIMFIEDDGRDANIESSVLSPAQSFSRKFDTAGTYRYYCKIHPEMKGTVIVV